jgi:SAM-dependent methyltransferase
MPDWNALFAREINIKRIPEAELYKFILLVEDLFKERPLRLWDIGCGAGRHTVAMSILGHDVYATDPAPRAVSITHQWLQERNLHAHVVQADMTANPWPNVSFHGALGWDSLYHDRLANITKGINGIYQALVPGGLFMATMKSDKADLYGQGREIEPKTFILSTGSEEGVPHHYFNEAEIRELFKDWRLMALCEQVITNVERPDRFWEYSPFPHTTWGVLAQKPQR